MIKRETARGVKIITPPFEHRVAISRSRVSPNFKTML
ncbi:hypothetical protein EV192_101754 [Actinocrispum wychmicini]|uniref:Uncharacterized protein n=1 Tax=Actinocrispum wychmicini TaxID=1213861 RepID=A0A4V2S8T3_9PSEU|nr:hypothetical protein EV192_101754 [Actinocrispum wychmicini]